MPAVPRVGETGRLDWGVLWFVDRVEAGEPRDLDGEHHAVGDDRVARVIRTLMQGRAEEPHCFEPDVWLEPIDAAIRPMYAKEP